MRKIIGTITVLFLLVGCTANADELTTITPVPTPDRTAYNQLAKQYSDKLNEMQQILVTNAGLIEKKKEIISQIELLQKQAETLVLITTALVLITTADVWTCGGTSQNGK